MGATQGQLDQQRAAAVQAGREAVERIILSSVEPTSVNQIRLELATALTLEVNARLGSGLSQVAINLFNREPEIATLVEAACEAAGKVLPDIFSVEHRVDCRQILLEIAQQLIQSVTDNLHDTREC